MVKDATSAPTSSQSVERVAKLSRRDFLNEYLLRNKPVILTDVVGRWPASNWSAESLKSKAGENEITVHYNEEGSFFDWYVKEGKRVDVSMPLGELIDLLTTGGQKRREYYMTEYRLRLVSPALLADVDFGDYFDPTDEPYEPMLFLGCDTCMPLHYHGKMEAFLCQISGEKRVTLYPPDHYSLLYPGAWHQRYPLFSRIDGRAIQADRVDTERFPKFQEARPIELQLHPGEMLFIPVHWWHLTGVDGFQISLSHFFRAKLRCWRFPTPGIPVLARETKDKLSSWLRTLRRKGA